MYILFAPALISLAFALVLMFAANNPFAKTYPTTLEAVEQTEAVDLEGELSPRPL